MVVPRANYEPRPHDGILVLQRGVNASTDYYLRPRLEAAGIAGAVCDVDAEPAQCALLGADGPRALMVIVCRYASSPWLAALEAARDRLARVAFFMDDDLPAMIADADLPRAVRGKVALHFGEHVARLGALASEVWVSTSALAARYPEADPAVLPPLPEADPPPPSEPGNRRVVYHGTDVHGRERRFAAEVARRLAALGAQAEVEITGDARLAAECADIASVTVAPQLAWPDYLERCRTAPAALSLAPLFPSPVNAARAPVKAFDAARLGAAGLYADVEPYRGFVRDGEDGLLLAMDPDAWAAAAAGLLADPERRRAMAGRARERLTALRRAGLAFPPPPAA